MISKYATTSKAFRSQSRNYYSSLLVCALRLLLFTVNHTAIHETVAKAYRIQTG